jgi:TolB-like protein
MDLQRIAAMLLLTEYNICVDEKWKSKRMLFVYFYEKKMRLLSFRLSGGGGGMRKTFIFRASCMVMVWVYCTVAAQAGQVITQKEKAWAKQALSITESEKNLAPLGASNTVGVLNFTNQTGLDDLNPLQKGLAIMLITDLSKVATLQVVERIKMQALLDEMSLGTSGLVDPNTAPKVGKLLRAHFISTGDLKLGKVTKLDINPVLVDIPLEKLSPLTATTGDMQDLFRMEKEILSGIIAQVKAQPTAKEREELDKPLTSKPGAALLFFVGVDFSDKGKYTDAARMYEKAILEDPKFSMAIEALQELKTLGLVNSGEGATAASSTAEKAVVEGSSRETVTLVALGALAVGGAALALSGGSGGGTSAPPKGPEIVSTDPVAGSVLTNCSYGAISFSFNENIRNCSDVGLTNGWTLASPQTISGGNVLVVNYQGSETVCYGDVPQSLAVTVSGCQNTQGSIMTPRTFTFLNTLPTTGRAQ